MAGLEILLKDEGEETVETFLYPGGITDYLNKLLEDNNPIEAQPFHSAPRQ